MTEEAKRSAGGDIVERLLERSQWLWTTNAQLKTNHLVKEAADEIMALRIKIDYLYGVEDDPPEIKYKVKSKEEQIQIQREEIRRLEERVDFLNRRSGELFDLVVKLTDYITKVGKDD